MSQINTLPKTEYSQKPSFWWSVIFGSNLGGNITPIGSASTVVAVTMTHKYQIKMSFAGFVMSVKLLSSLLHN